MRSHGLMYAALAALMSRHGGIPLASLPRKTFRQLTSHRSYHATSKYTPHQGTRECERRRRQMANGTHGYRGHL